MTWSKNALLSYKETLLRVRYNAGKFNNNGVEVEYPAVDELRPLSLLDASIRK
jgi:hypothetical protein